MKTVLHNISSAFKDLTSKMTALHSFVLLLLVVIFGFIWFFTPVAQEFYKNAYEIDEKSIRRKLEIEAKVRKEMDSLQMLYDELQNNLFVEKNNKINDLMAYLERRFPGSSHITISSVHNGGGVPRTGSDSGISPLYTTDNVKGVNILKEYKDFPLYPGYAEFFYQLFVRKGRDFYVEDVTKYPAIYNGETKETMDKLNTRSIYGMWIKSGPVSTYYITASFDVKNGLDATVNNFPRLIIKDARNRLVNLIDVQQKK